MRASASLDDRYRAAPATRASSRLVRSGGSAVAVTVPATPRATASSANVAIGLPGGPAFGLGAGGRDLRLQLQEVFLPDAADVHQLLDLLERPVLLAVLDDTGGRFGADARQRFELAR